MSEDILERDHMLVMLVGNDLRNGGMFELIA